jgi:hypothetical protein
MSYSFADLRHRANHAVAFALNEIRRDFHKGLLTEYWIGYAHGQILIAHCDLYADAYIIEGARNEINFLWKIARTGGAA